jgi:hypothetical protein
MGEAKRRKRAKYHPTMDDVTALMQLVECADELWDGHVTIMKFTTNWRVGFGTLASGDIMELRADIAEMAEGKTLAEAAAKALSEPRHVSPMDYEMDADGQYLRDRPRDGEPHHKSEVERIASAVWKHERFRRLHPAGWPDDGPDDDDNG